MKCMGDFGTGEDIETEDYGEEEMGFKIKMPKIKIKGPNLKKITKPISNFIKNPVKAIDKGLKNTIQTSVLNPINKAIGISKPKAKAPTQTAQIAEETVNPVDIEQNTQAVSQQSLVPQANKGAGAMKIAAGAVGAAALIYFITGRD